MNLLNLPDWNIEHVEDSARDYRVHATYGPEPSQCVHCGKGTLFAGKLYRHGTREQLLMDLPAHGKRVGILLTRNRYRCQDCGKTFLQSLPDVDERSQMTRRLVRAIKKAAAAGYPFALIARTVGVSERTVRNLHYDDRRRKKRGRGIGPKKPDEAGLLEYLASTTDLDKRRNPE